MRPLIKYVERLGIALSILLNVVLGGRSNQTFSARNWAWKQAGRYNIVWLIDFLASWYESNHCERSWSYWAYIIKNYGETRNDYYDRNYKNHYDYQ